MVEWANGWMFERPNGWMAGSLVLMYLPLRLSQI